VKRGTSDWVAIILAAGLSIAVVALVAAVGIAAVEHGNTASSLSDNETQVLTAAFSGTIGLLGGWLGYKAGNGQKHLPEEGWPEPEPPEQTLPWPAVPKKEEP